MANKRTTSAPKRREQIDRDVKRLYPDLDVYDLPFGIKGALLLLEEVKGLEGFHYLPDDVKQVFVILQAYIEVGAEDMIESLKDNKEFKEKAEALDAYLVEQSYSKAGS